MKVNYFCDVCVMPHERIFHVFDMSFYALCVSVRVGRLTFDSREASSLLEADIGVAVHEIMGIMNKVKHRPRGQYFSQRAGEKRNQALSVASSLTSLCFLQTEGNCQPKTSVVWTDVYLFNNLKPTSAGPPAGTPSVGGCPAKHTQIGPSLMHDVGKRGREAVGWCLGSDGHVF